MWYGDKLTLASQPPRPSSTIAPLPQSAQNSDPALDTLLNDYIIKARNKICSSGKSTGKYRCTWACGYSTDSRDAWERHEERKQPQKFWVCASCRDPDLDEGNNELPFITCRKDKFLPHVAAIHTSEINGDGLRNLSRVHSTADFLRFCNFVKAGNDLACNHYFHSWKERNDHYIAHFEEDPLGDLDPPDDESNFPGAASGRKDGRNSYMKRDTGRKTGTSTAPGCQGASSGSYTQSPNSRSRPETGASDGSILDETGDIVKDPPRYLLNVTSLRLVHAKPGSKFLALKYDPAHLERIVDGDLILPHNPLEAQMPPLERFPLLLRDGILLTREMDFEYVWIDMLCSPTTSSDHVETLYKTADLIIVLGRSTGTEQRTWHFTCDYEHMTTVQTWAEQAVSFHHIEPLGHGAYSFVDKVEMRPSPNASASSSSIFARKVVLRSSKHKSLRNRCLDEIEIMRKFNHPHIAQFVAAYYDRAAFNIIMSPVADCDLRQYLTDPERFPGLRSNLPDWFMSLAEALAYMHRIHCRHKDIKPANILISHGKVLLTDFGTSIDFSDSQSQSVGGAFMTPKYCAPEVAAQQDRGRSADLFSLGCVYTEMITIGVGKTLEDLHQAIRFNDGTGKTAYHLRIRDTLSWLKHLNGQHLSECQRRILSVTAGMLARKRDRRPTAAEVVGKLCSKKKCDGSLRMHATCHCCPSLVVPALSGSKKREFGNHGFQIAAPRLSKRPLISIVVEGFGDIESFAQSLCFVKMAMRYGLIQVSKEVLTRRMIADRQAPWMPKVRQRALTLTRPNLTNAARRAITVAQHTRTISRMAQDVSSAPSDVESQALAHGITPKTSVEGPQLSRQNAVPDPKSIGKHQYRSTVTRKRKHEQALWFPVTSAFDAEATQARASKRSRMSMFIWLGIMTAKCDANYFQWRPSRGQTGAMSQHGL